LKEAAIATSASAPRPREFVFGDEDFQALRTLVHKHTGISLSEAKRELVYGRLSRRLRVLGLESFRDYRQLLANPDGHELVDFCNAITTNLTSFFRESHHFEHLAAHILKPLAAEPIGRRLRIWSAGCSSGEEPYSTAMTIHESVPDWQRRDIRILATDLDSDVLSRGQRGIYAEDRLKGMARKRVDTFFRERRESGVTRYAVTPELAQLITFKQLNLMNELPMRGPFDVIFCRNVVIYFDKDTQRALFRRFALLQRPGDLLFLGHSESMFKVSNDYTLIGRTIYKRNES